MVRGLMTDPGTMVFAAMQGWDYPMSREAMALADLYDVAALDLTRGSKGPKPKPYPRPWRRDRQTHKYGTVIRPDQVRAVLEGFGRPVPPEWQSYDPPDRQLAEDGAEKRPRLVTTKAEEGGDP